MHTEKGEVGKFAKERKELKKRVSAATATAPAAQF